MKKQFLRTVSLLLTAVLFVGMFTFAAPSVAALTTQQQIDELEKEQKKLKQQIESARGDANNSKKTRDLYNSQIQNVKKQIDLLDGQIADLNGQISNKNTEIAALEEKIAANRKQETEVRALLGKRLNALAKRGNLSSLQMLMNTENYTEYLVKSKLMQRVAEKDQAAIEQLEKELEQIHQTEQAVKTEKSSIEAKKAEIDKLRSASTSKKAELDNLYVKANAAYKQDAAELNALNKELQETENSIKRLLASLNSSGTYAASSMYWPVPTVRAMSSGFGTRWGTLHKGIDIANGPVKIYGQNVVAAADGTVIYANSTSTWGGGYGYYCMVDHGRDSKGRQIVTLYAHCSKMFARVGQKVVGGKTVLAQAGSTGNVTGPHLHFEVRVNGSPVDPIRNGYVAVNGK